METLSNEMLYHIVSFCDDRELCALSLADRTFFSLCSEEKFWMELCKKKNFPDKDELYSWKEWYKKLSSPFLVECHWYYGKCRDLIFKVNYGITFGQLRKKICKGVGYNWPENVAVGVDGKDEEVIPVLHLSHGLFICWAK
uniref:F-box containing protein n=1 Tax=Marseillevirus sp. TaxID=2809551 RepID=A0AA96J118_9VIRU|nr:F-box containing protein [Marseillevirus sp.]